MANSVAKRTMLRRTLSPIGRKDLDGTIIEHLLVRWIFFEVRIAHGNQLGNMFDPDTLTSWAL